MLKTILLINHYAGSQHHGMEFRPYYMARRWVCMGYRVMIVAASYSHVRKINPEIKKGSRIESIDGITYLWISTPRYGQSGLARILNMLTFVVRISLLSRRLSRLSGLCAVIASSTYPLDVYPAKRIARLSYARLIFEVHDLWPLSPMELGNYRWYHPFILLMQSAENFAYRNSNFVVSILPKTLEHMIEHGLDKHKFIHIPNGIEPDETISTDIAATNGYDFIIGDSFKVGYTGAVGRANALWSLLETAQRLRSHERIKFIIVGSGELSADIESFIRSEQLNNVILIPSLHKSQIPGLLTCFDVCYIGLQKQPLFRFGISPNKLFDYMLAGRPVLQAIDAGNDIVAQAECGRTVEPENPQAIADAILDFYSMTDSQRDQMGAKGRSYVLAHHTYEKLAAQFAELFEK